MWRSTDWRKAWPLLSSRLKRLVRQNPMSRLPARERSAITLASAVVGGSCGLLVDVVAQTVAWQRQLVDRVDNGGGVESRRTGRRDLDSSILNVIVFRHADWEVGSRSVRKCEEFPTGMRSRSRRSSPE